MAWDRNTTTADFVDNTLVPLGACQPAIDWLNLRRNEKLWKSLRDMFLPDDQVPDPLDEETRSEWAYWAMLNLLGEGNDSLVREFWIRGATKAKRTSWARRLYLRWADLTDAEDLILEEYLDQHAPEITQAVRDGILPRAKAGA